MHIEWQCKHCLRENWTSRFAASYFIRSKFDRVSLRELDRFLIAITEYTVLDPKARKLSNYTVYNNAVGMRDCSLISDRTWFVIFFFLLIDSSFPLHSHTIAISAFARAQKEQVMKLSTFKQLSTLAVLIAVFVVPRWAPFSPSSPSNVTIWSTRAVYYLSDSHNFKVESSRNSKLDLLK